MKTWRRGDVKREDEEDEEDREDRKDKEDREDQEDLPTMKQYQEALQILLQHTCSFGEEVCALEEVHGRVLAQDVLADRDYPPFNRAAMDGYAGRSEEVKKWRSGEGAERKEGAEKKERKENEEVLKKEEGKAKGFRVKEVLFAGSIAAGLLQEGELYKIMTGAAVPDDADFVIRVEDTSMNEDGTVNILVNDLVPFQHISRKGEDIRKGEILVSKNTLCDAGVVALLAAAGQLTVMVKRNPSVAIITSGNEVKPLDYPVTDVQIRNSNRYQLIASLQKLGISNITSFHSNDEIDELRATFLKAWEADIIISCGAVSMGDADHIPDVLTGLGAECLFHKVAIKPGKPVWCGIRPNRKIIFALPGNPFSTRVNTRIFIQPFINACLGQEQIDYQFEFEGIRTKKSTLDEFFPAKINASGKIESIAFNGSGDIRAGAHAMGIAMHPSGKMRIENGERLRFYFF